MRREIIKELLTFTLFTQPREYNCIYIYEASFRQLPEILEYNINVELNQLYIYPHIRIFKRKQRLLASVLGELSYIIKTAY